MKVKSVLYISETQNQMFKLLNQENIWLTKGGNPELFRKLDKSRKTY